MTTPTNHRVTIILRNDTTERAVVVYVQPCTTVNGRRTSLMPMNKALYPIDWHEIALAIKEAVDWQCQQCEVQCRRPGEPFDSHRRTLTVAHWDHNLDAKEV